MKVRVIEMEGEGAALLEAVQALGMGQAKLAPRRPQGRRQPRKAAAREGEAENDELGRRGAKMALVRRALEEGPKTAQEIVAWVRAHGWPGAQPGQTHSRLQSLKRLREAILKDGKWHAA